MKKFKKFCTVLLLVLLVSAITFFLVSFIVANIHKISVVAEWKDWGHGISTGWHKMINWFKK